MKMKKITTFVLAGLLFVSTLTTGNEKVEADYSDNYSRLYYDLSDYAYKFKHNQTGYLSAYSSIINSTHGAGKFEVISVVDPSTDYKHEMSLSRDGTKILGLEATGFKAFAVVARGSRKLWISFSGTDTYTGGLPTIHDALTAQDLLSGSTPGQIYQAQLFINYIYKAFPFKSYDWYFTGHSLGGWLATKSYLDIRAGRWAIPDDSKFKYGGPIEKEHISGVYTFNPLPMRKNQITEKQWTSNQDKLYNSQVKNLIVNNEWLNAVHDMHKGEMAYIGTQGEVSKGLSSYIIEGYDPKSSVLQNIVLYADRGLDNNEKYMTYHGLDALAQSVGY